MANSVKYGNEYSHLTLNGINIVDLGETDPPITIEDLEDRSTLKRGVNGRFVRIDNVTRGKRLTVNLIPGSPQVRQLIALDKAGVDFEFLWFQSDTNETITGFGGIMQSRGELTRAGKTTASDERFVFIFNDSEET